MSSYQQVTKHPDTGVMEMADWLDDYFGRHRYGVRFADGKVFRAEQIDAVETNGVASESTPGETTVHHWDGSTDNVRKERR